MVSNVCVFAIAWFVDCVNRKIKVWDLAAALDPRAPTGTLCVRTLVVSVSVLCIAVLEFTLVLESRLQSIFSWTWVDSGCD